MGKETDWIGTIGNIIEGDEVHVNSKDLKPKTNGKEGYTIDTGARAQVMPDAKHQIPIKRYGNGNLRNLKDMKPVEETYEAPIEIVNIDGYS